MCNVTACKRSEVPTLSAFMEGRPNCWFDLSPQEALKGVSVRVYSPSGAEVTKFHFDTREDAQAAIDDAVEAMDPAFLKERIVETARQSSIEAGSDCIRVSMDVPIAKIFAGLSVFESSGLATSLQSRPKEVATVLGRMISEELQRHLKDACSDAVDTMLVAIARGGGNSLDLQ